MNGCVLTNLALDNELVLQRKVALEARAHAGHAHPVARHRARALVCVCQRVKMIE